jgi:hypothetical protein
MEIHSKLTQQRNVSRNLQKELKKDVKKKARLPKKATVCTTKKVPR